MKKGDEARGRSHRRLLWVDLVASSASVEEVDDSSRKVDIFGKAFKKLL
jgi:hypothetical protein